MGKNLRKKGKIKKRKKIASSWTLLSHPMVKKLLISNQFTETQKHELEKLVLQLSEKRESIHLKISELKKEIAGIKKEILSQKNRKKTNSEIQNNNPELFYVKQDLSQRNLKRILAPLKTELKHFQSEKEQLKANFEQTLQQFASAVKMQQELF